jgi:hypothetical protein
METLAYLHLIDDYESSETKELNTDALKSKAAIGLLGAAVMVGVVSVADSASACGYYGCGGGGYYGYSHYRPRYHSYHYYSYRPHYYSYRHYNPCW